MRAFVVAILLFLAGPALGQDGALSPQVVLRDAVNGMIRPAVADFQREADGLQMAVEGMCQVPSAATVTIVNYRFERAALAYGRIEFLRLGPLMEDNRAERLLFWPDRRGIGLRQVQALLAEGDAGAVTLDGLRAKSIAVQGFGALEYVLYGTGAETLTGADGAYRCQYGAAIAGNISQIADELARGWFTYDGIALRLVEPRSDYADYRSDIEAMEALVGMVAHGLEATRDARINPFMASDGGAAKPKQALFWRSGLTMAMVRANLDGMHRLMTESGIARAVGEANKGLDNSIDFEFRNATRALNLIPSPVEQAVEDQKQVQALNYLVLVTGSLQAMVGEQLATALGLSVGFSSLDGD